MPIYVYEVKGGECPYCPGQFEMLEGIHDKPLKRCPACDCPVHRIMAAANGIIRGAGTDPISRAQAAGLKALKRDDSGDWVDIKTKKKVTPHKP